MEKWESQHNYVELIDNIEEPIWEWNKNIFSVKSSVKNFIDSILEKIGVESKLEQWWEYDDGFVWAKVHIYRYIFNSYLNAQMLGASIRSDEIYSDKEVSLQRYSDPTLEQLSVQDKTVLINIPGILTKTNENNEIFENFFSSLQTNKNGTKNLKPLVNEIIIPNYYYNARDLSQVDYFWEYLQDLILGELQNTHKVILVWHSFGGILWNALLHQMLEQWIDSSRLGLITYCTPHWESPLTRKTHFQPARELIGYTQRQAKNVPTIAFAGEHDKWVWDNPEGLFNPLGENIKTKILPQTWHDGNLGGTVNQRKITAALRVIAGYV